MIHVTEIFVARVINVVRARVCAHTHKYIHKLYTIHLCIYIYTSAGSMEIGKENCLNH